MSLTIVNAEWAAGQGSDAELQRTVASLEAQLAALYAEKEQGAWAAAPADGAADLIALYEEKLRAGAQAHAALRESADSLVAQLEALYAEREADGGEADAVADLAAQLSEFYAAQERAGGRDLDTLRETADGLVAQVEALYAERDDPAVREAPEMVESLTAQVAALLDERADAEAEIARLHAEVAAVQERARRLVDAVVAQSLQAA